MNKKVIILIVCAVVVIAGAAIAVPLVRNSGEAEPVTTPTDVVETTATPHYLEPSELVTAPLPSELETSAVDSIVTTTKKVVATTKKVVATTKKVEQTASKPAIIQSANEELAQAAVLGYSYMPGTKPYGDFYYCDDKDCWQVDYGYNEMYDKYAAATVMFIDCIRVRFTYDNLDWMIQLWKGQYGWLFVGGEIGVYTTEHGSTTGADTDINHYDCAAKENWLNMEMKIFWQEEAGGPYKLQFVRSYGKYWWCTGFQAGLLRSITPPRDEMRMWAHITFKSATMANLFLDGLRSRGFGKAGDSSCQAADSYFYDGADVWFLWSDYIDSTLGS